MSESFAVDGPGRELSPDEQDAMELVEHAHQEQLAQPVVMGVDLASGPERVFVTFRSPADTRGWTPFRVAGVECWRAKDGSEWTRAKMGEQFEAVVIFERIGGMGPLHLVQVDNSANIGRVERKERRAARELSKRGY